ncbi:MAG: hypothetical protein AUH43_24025 [Acidobacteria bacterium 13_1_40CM_65_14]|nr:MAG: hypothetical protein AUH43_24025 [Acidobacteria bacterium 13_1_40CM_65_14]
MPFACALAAAIGGAIVAWHYHRLGLTLTHYDARGHLVVARRIVDSITPGWQQIGAVWLPLPHLLNALPVQVDLFYRTGASAVVISVAAFAVATGAIASIVLTLTESPAAAFASAAVFALNPNVLYLQSTPMTEPLLIALTTLGVAMLMGWCRSRSAASGEAPAAVASADARATRAGVESPRASRKVVGVGPHDKVRKVGWIFVFACLTRYEAWPVAAGALTAAAWARWRGGEPLATALRRVGEIARYPALAIVAFAIFSRVVIGQWFVSSDFFVPENKALNDPVMAAAEILWGLRAMSGDILLIAGAAGLVFLVALGLFNRRRGGALVAAALVGTAAVPWLAFYEGHPFRIRYMVPLIAMEAIGTGAVVGLIKRKRTVNAKTAKTAKEEFSLRFLRPLRSTDADVAAAVLLLAVAAFELHPLDGSAPMVVEAQWDRPNVPERARVTACLGQPGSGQKIMASMGSLGHYMQETSRAGFAIRDFLHEGNGDIWLAALDDPLPYAEWILIEEKAEGGDMLAKRAREQPNFLSGYSRACEGAGLALYVRTGSSPRTDR